MSFNTIHLPLRTKDQRRSSEEKEEEELIRTESNDYEIHNETKPTGEST